MLVWCVQKSFQSRRAAAKLKISLGAEGFFGRVAEVTPEEQPKWINCGLHCGVIELGPVCDAPLLTPP